MQTESQVFSGSPNLATLVQSQLKHTQKVYGSQRSFKSEYWYHITQNTLREINVWNDLSPFDARLNAPKSFSGTPANAGSEILLNRNFIFFFQVVTNLIRVFHRLPDFWLTRLILRKLYYVLTLKSALEEGKTNYQFFVNSFELVLRNDLKKFEIDSPRVFGVDSTEVISDRGSGRVMSFHTIRNFNIFLRIFDDIPEACFSVIEIGAGIGELSRIFLQSKKCTNYFIVDIPPVLAFSERFLRASLGATCDFDGFNPDRHEVEISKTRQKVTFLTPDQMSLIKSANLALNIASFGEMSRENVANYFAILNTIKVERIISINQRLKKAGNLEGVGEVEYLQFAQPLYKVRRKGSFPMYMLIPEIMEDVPAKQGYQYLCFES